MNIIYYLNDLRVIRDFKTSYFIDTLMYKKLHILYMYNILLYTFILILIEKIPTVYVHQGPSNI